MNFSPKLKKNKCSEKCTTFVPNLFKMREIFLKKIQKLSPISFRKSFRNIRQVRNRPAQTELTIPPNLDLDLKKLLGEQFVYQPDEEDEEDDEEVFNVSVSSNFSTRRRLFSAGGTPGAPRDDEDEADDVENSSMLSNDDLMLNETNGQHFVRFYKQFSMGIAGKKFFF